jgi:hypothetical protein
LCINDGRIFATRKLFTQSAIEVPNVEGQDQRVEGIRRGVFLLSSLNSPFCDLSMILVGTNWTSGGRSGKTKLVKRNRGHLVEEKDVDDEDLQMLNNVP